MKTVGSGDRKYNAENIAWKEETEKLADDAGSGWAGFYLDLYEKPRKGAPFVVTPESARRRIAIIEKRHKLRPV